MSDLPENFLKVSFFFKAHFCCDRTALQCLKDFVAHIHTYIYIYTSCCNIARSLHLPKHYLGASRNFCNNQLLLSVSNFDPSVLQVCSLTPNCAALPVGCYCAGCLWTVHRFVSHDDFRQGTRSRNHAILLDAF